MFKARNVLFSLIALVAFVLPLSVSAAPKLTAEQAGAIGRPEGKIAFIREKNVWAMNADGSQQELISEVTNCEGKLTWSADNKAILFTRSGLVDLKGPDMMGGRHKVYDLFQAFVDSAYHNNRLFWLRMTDDLGSRDPEWSADGNRIVFWKDLKANEVNSMRPNYQIVYTDGEGDNLQIVRKDWQVMEDDSVGFWWPTMNAKGDIACVLFAGVKTVGLIMLPKDGYMMGIDSMYNMALRNKSMTGPAWSPDSKWLVYINNDLNNSGVYLATPDLKQKFLVFKPPVTTNMRTVAPSFSPNSKWLTFATIDGSIWICDIMGNNSRRLTGPGIDSAPTWSKAATK